MGLLRCQSKTDGTGPTMRQRTTAGWLQYVCMIVYEQKASRDSAADNARWTVTGAGAASEQSSSSSPRRPPPRLLHDQPITAAQLLSVKSCHFDTAEPFPFRIVRNKHPHSYSHRLLYRLSYAWQHASRSSKQPGLLICTALDNIAGDT